MALVCFKMTKAELAHLLESFADGTCGEWEWDDFLSIPHKDSEIEKIRDHCEQLDVEFPPNKPGQFCNEEGLAVLLGYARLLREQTE